MLVNRFYILKLVLHSLYRYYGGWAAPNIYFLGFAGMVKFGNIHIAGLSGIYDKDDRYMIDVLQAGEEGSRVYVHRGTGSNTANESTYTGIPCKKKAIDLATQTPKTTSALDSKKKRFKKKQRKRRRSGGERNCVQVEFS